MEPLILSDKVACAYNRKGEVVIDFCECEITKTKTWCVSMDSSEGEYGAISVSIEYLYQKMNEHKQKF